MNPPESSPLRWRQAGIITAIAAAVLAGLHFVPAGPRLNHLDFVPGGAEAALQFCDPTNPRFLPVVARSSPVTMTLEASEPVRGLSVNSVVTLRTVTGKPIGPGDLLPTEGRSVHLLIVDPSLEDFQVARLAPAGRAGDWVFVFTPRREGLYRVFADFTPAATEQEMYASADLSVGAVPSASAGDNSRGPPSGISGTAEVGGYRFTLEPAIGPILARQTVNLVLTVSRLDGGRVPLQQTFGAFGHLVIFDENRTGFVALHSLDAGGPHSSAAEPRLIFKVSIPDPGRYVAWSRIDLAGREIDAPFRIDVSP